MLIKQNSPLLPRNLALGTFGNTAWKTKFSFSRRPKKMVFLKKIALEYDLSCIVGKDHVSFPNKMILHLRRKMKGDLSQKKYTKIWHFIQIFWKDGLFKKGRRWDMIFLVLSGKMVFFPWKHDIFPLGRKWEMTFSRNTWKYDIFCVHVRVLQT